MGVSVRHWTRGEAEIPYQESMLVGSAEAKPRRAVVSAGWHAWNLVISLDAQLPRASKTWDHGGVGIAVCRSPVGSLDLDNLPITEKNLVELGLDGIVTDVA